MTDREAQIEALWTYEISKEKVLKRLVKKGIMTQAEADDLSERMLEQLDADKIPGFRLSPLGEKMRTNSSCLNPYVSLTEIAKGIKTSRGKGGGTIAHPEIAAMFQAWLFPKFMLELIQWYRGF